MNSADKTQSHLPRYGIGEDEKTRPCIVLFDWNGDDEATARVSPIGPRALAFSSPQTDLDDDIEVELFRRRSHGIGRRPGAVALAVVLGLSVTIGAFAIWGSGEAQAAAADSSSLLSH